MAFKVFLDTNSSNFTDLEDAFQYFTALHDPDMEYFLTNNIKDFKSVISSPPVVTPEKFLSHQYLK